ncbi:MAG: glycosyltransferase [Elusimicrobiota bacterium]|nr:glycosyltransferase [Elusimicrobiota bacterium]
MRLLLVPDPSSPNGEDAFCREVAKRAPARGHTATVRVVAPGPAAATAELLARERFAADHDAVFINSLQPAALRAARAAGRPAALRLIDSYAGASQAALEEVQELARSADVLLVPSRHLQGVVAGWNIGPERVRIAPYAYDQIFAQQIALVTLRASRPAAFGIVAAGTLDDFTRPAFETALSALARLRLDWHLTIIGDGPALPALRERAKSLLLGDNKVSFPGELPHPKKMEYLRAAKAYVELGGHLGFPSLALHALSEGCPVIGVSAGAVPELITHFSNGLLFPPGDAAALAEQVLNLAATPGLSLKLIAEGVRTVERHSWDATAAAALDALEALGVKA